MYRHPDPEFDAELPGERWLPTPGFEIDYEVSDLGRVRRTTKPASGPSYPGRVLRHGAVGGYAAVSLRDDARARPRRVHVLVAIAFLGPRPPKHDINHIDGNKMNPALSNLEYVTRSENQLHSTRILGNRRGSKLPWAKLSESDVSTIRRRAASGELHRIIAVDYGVSRPTVSSVVAGHTWRHV